MLVYLHVGVLIVCDTGVPDLPQMLHESLHQPWGLWVIVLLKLMSVPSIKWYPVVTPNNLGKRVRWVIL